MRIIHILSLSQHHLGSKIKDYRSSRSKSALSADWTSCCLYNPRLCCLLWAVWEQASLQLPEGDKSIALGPACQMVPEYTGIWTVAVAVEGLSQRKVVHFSAEVSHKDMEMGRSILCLLFLKCPIHPQFLQNYSMCIMLLWNGTRTSCLKYIQQYRTALYMPSSRCKSGTAPWAITLFLNLYFAGIIFQITAQNLTY